MNSLLDVPSVRERILPISVEIYHRLTEGLRTELLQGTIIEKMSKCPLDVSIAQHLGEILTSQIKSEFTLFLESPLTTKDSELEPDLCVVRGEIGNFRNTHPKTAELVIEVAVTSLEIDRVKASIYADAGVKEYWIVCPTEKRVEVYRQPEPAGQYYADSQIASGGTVLTCAALPDVKIDLRELFA